MPDKEHSVTNPLAIYAETGSESAFGEVVSKHSGMVFGVAMRKTGNNRPVAEEVTQNVFTILARKAGALKEESALSGWLFRTTLFECSHALRRERSQKRKLQAFTEHESLQSQMMEKKNNIPGLDEAMARLSPGDQNVLLLRFIEGLSYREIGDRILKSEDASQKMTSRALEKLRSILKKKGASFSAIAVATTLTAKLTQAAPAGLSAIISKNAITGAAALSSGTTITNTLEIMTYGKLKTGLVAAVLIAAIPIAVQWLKINSLSREVDSAAAKTLQLASASSPSAPRGSGSLNSARPTNSPNRRSAAAYLEDSIAAKGDWHTSSAIVAELNRLDAVALEDLLAETESHPGAGGPKRELIGYIIRALAQKAPGAAIEHAVRLQDTQSANFCVRLWAKQDPDTAWKWLRAQQTAGKLTGASIPNELASIEPSLFGSFIKYTSEQNYDQAAAYAEFLTGGNLLAALRELGQHHFEKSRKGSFLESVGALTASDEEKNRMLRDVANRNIWKTGEKTANWVFTQSSPRFLESNIKELMSSWSSARWQDAEQWISGLGDMNLRETATASLAEAFMTTRPYMSRDKLMPGKAVALAETIQNPELRAATLQRIQELRASPDQNRPSGGNEQ